MTPGRRRLAVAVAALALLVGCTSPGAQHREPPSAASSGQTAGGATAARSFRSVRGYRATPLPVRLEIPRIGVASSLDRLGRAPDGTVQEPSRWEVPGWYEPGPRPGDPGSAVLLSHVDSKHGPAVFFRLPELRRGDEVRVKRADGSSVQFVVQRIAKYDKQRFPTDEVYYPTLTSMLQLVTCGGQFDTASGHYRSNIIVFATMRP
jgi:Sortase domain